MQQLKPSPIAVEVVNFSLAGYSQIMLYLLSLLQTMDNEPDQRRNARAIALADAAAVRQQIKIERGGALLPDSGEVIASLREQRTELCSSTS